MLLFDHSHTKISTFVLCDMVSHSNYRFSNSLRLFVQIKQRYYVIIDIMISSLVMTFFTNLGVTGILCSFRIVLEGKTYKEIPESSRLEFLEMFLANNFALSDVEEYISGLLNSRSITDLPLLRTLLAIQQ